jgi:GTP-binding protein HflX
MPTGAIVGYTNAGKSSLLNALTGSAVYACDKLFATWIRPRDGEPSRRQGGAPDRHGRFCPQAPPYPHRGIQATLEETVLADFLINVVDISSPEAGHHYEATCAVLREIGAGDKRMITVWNKMDLVSETTEVSPLPRIEGIPVSAASGRGIDRLLSEIERITAPSDTATRFLLPFSRFDILALLRRSGTVLSEEFDGESVMVEALVTEKTRSMLRRYVLQ